MLLVALASAGGAARAIAAPGAAAKPLVPAFSEPVAFDRSQPLRVLAQQPARRPALARLAERGPLVTDAGHSGDAALQSVSARSLAAALAIAAPTASFEG